MYSMLNISFFSSDYDSFKALPGVRLSPPKAVLPRAVVPRLPRRRLHRHRHPRHRRPLRQVKELQVQR